MTDKIMMNSKGEKFIVTDEDLRRVLPDSEYRFVRMCVDDPIIARPETDSRNSIINKYHASTLFTIEVLEKYKHLMPKFCEGLNSIWHGSLEAEELPPEVFACLTRWALCELVGQWANINRVAELNEFQKDNV